MIGLSGGLGAFYRGVDLQTAPPAGSVYDAFDAPDDGATSGLGHRGGNMGAGQSWQSDGSPTEITGVRLRLRRSNEVWGGVLQVGIKAHSGTYGTSSVPTGPFLVRAAEDYAVDDVAGSYTDYYFPLSGWTPDPTTEYVVVIEPLGVLFHSNNALTIVQDDGAAATHGGNQSVRTATVWSANSGIDLDFAVYATGGYTPVPAGDGTTYTSNRIRAPLDLYSRVP